MRQRSAKVTAGKANSNGVLKQKSLGICRSVMPLFQNTGALVLRNYASDLWELAMKGQKRVVTARIVAPVSFG